MEKKKADINTVLAHRDYYKGQPKAPVYSRNPKPGTFLHGILQGKIRINGSCGEGRSIAELRSVTGG